MSAAQDHEQGRVSAAAVCVREPASVFSWVFVILFWPFLLLLYVALRSIFGVMWLLDRVSGGQAGVASRGTHRHSCPP
jgi:hypothetical protein